MTKFLGRTYICDIANGIDFNDIRIPEVNAWEMVDTYKWDTVPYNEWEVVEYEGKFFTLLTIRYRTRSFVAIDSLNYLAYFPVKVKMTSYRITDSSIIFKDEFTSI